MTGEQPTDREEAEGELFRLLVENVKDYAIFVVDLDGRVRSWNPGAERVLGYTEAEILGQSFERFFTPEDVRTGVPQQELRDARETGRGPDDRWHVRKDGSRFWAGGVMTPLWDADRALRGFAKILRDRTEWKQAETALRSSEVRHAAVLDAALDAVITIDGAGRVVVFNPAAERLFGHIGASVLGRDVGDLLVPPRLRDAHRRGMAHYLATGEGPVLGRRIEMPALRADGSEVAVELSITVVPTDGPPLFTAYLRDVSGRAEGERRRGARLAVTQALAGAATVREAVPAVLRAVCDGLGWDVGGFWARDERAGVLRCLDVWHGPQFPAGEFEAETRRRTFGPGVGLPGRVWATGRPAWIPDITRDDNFPRAAAANREGLHGAFACPVRVGPDVLGVVEFFSRQLRQPDADVLEMMATIGGQIGQFVERQRAEAAVRESEERFRGLMEQAPFSIQVFAPDGRTLRVNRAWEELWGVTLDQVADYNILHDAQLDARGVLPYIQRAFAGEAVEIPAIQYDPNETIPDRTRHKDPRRWVSAVAYPLKDDGGRVREVVLVHTDVTAARRAEEALRESERLYRAIGESIDYGVWVCDPDGRNLYASESFLRLVGLTQEQCSSFGWGNVLHPDDVELTLAAWQECVRTGGQWDVEHRFRGVDGRWHPILARGVPVRNDCGEITAWAGINLDIGRLKQVEEELREADRRKDEFLATLAHELRNPLAPIRNSLQILKMPRIDAAIVERSREMMERQVHHLVRLVDDLLDVSRVMRGKVELRRERVELAAVVARAVETAQPLIDVLGHELTVAVSPDSLPLDADPVRLTQVVGNLLTNAAKYTEVNGHIWLEAGREEGTAILRVRDTGIGIAADMLPRVFDLFVQADHATTRAQGGLGIGLTLVRNLVEMHGGTVAARSDGPGRGSEFVVRLPLAARVGDAAPAAAEERAPTTAAARRILVVDDNRDAAESLATMLRLQGHRVEVAYDGGAAVAAARAFAPQTVFLDLGMPVVDGFEVARRLRREPGLRGAVLVAVTGWGQEVDRQRSADAGFDHHLVKPVEPAAVQRVLAER